VTDHLGKGGPNYFYRVEFTPVKPRLSFTLPKVDIFGYSQERQTIAVRAATVMRHLSGPAASTLAATSS